MESSVANLLQNCPTCGTELARAKFLEVQRRLRDQDEERAKKASAEAVKEANKVLAEERKRLSAEKAAAEEKAKATEAAFKDKIAQQQAALQEATARMTAEKADLDKRVAEVVASTRKQVEAEATKKAAAEREAVKAKEEESAKERAAELAKVRELDRAENDKKLAKERADHTREKEALLKTVEGLKRKVEAKTPNELGDGAEIDLFEDLKAAFDSKGDKIRRVPKGQPGADIIHEVAYKNVTCGKILIDSKNRQAWQNGYTTKLREDKSAEKADYAVLASIVFPKDEKELCIRDDVIVVQPARVVAIVRLLRQGLVRIHQQMLSDEKRDEKKARLYALIASEQFRQRFEQAGQLTKALLDMDVEETTAHKKVWMKRGNALKNMERLIGGLDEEIRNIVDGSSNG